MLYKQTSQIKKIFIIKMKMRNGRINNFLNTVEYEALQSVTYRQNHITNHRATNYNRKFVLDVKTVVCSKTRLMLNECIHIANIDRIPFLQFP
jgi:hypothetical protein